MPRFASDRIWGLTRRGWVWSLLGLLLLLGLNGFFLTLGPKGAEPMGLGHIEGRQAQLDHKLAGVEARYRALDPDAPIPQGMRSQLLEAIRAQEKFFDGRAEPDSRWNLRLHRLRVALATVDARAVWPELESLQKKLEGSVGEAKERRALQERLLALRRKINRSEAEARYKDIVAEIRLARELRTAKAVPLRDAAVSAEKQARSALAKEDWVAAWKYFGQALSRWEEINREYADTRFANLAKGVRLENERARLQGAAEDAQIGVLLRGAAEARTKGEKQRAGAYFAQAAELQKRINKQWPRSRFRSTSRLRQMEIDRQSVAGSLVLAEIREADAEVGRLLAQRRVLAAKRRIAQVAERVKGWGGKFAKSHQSDGGLSLKYQYLVALGEQLRSLQDDVYEALVPLPGDPGVSLSREEVPQSLYKRVMRVNPIVGARSIRSPMRMLWSFVDASVGFWVVRCACQQRQK